MLVSSSELWETIELDVLLTTQLPALPIYLKNFTPINITSANGANLAIENITSAIEYVSSMRATLGAMENRLEFTINSLLNQSVNSSAARSRIVDANMAVESAQLVKKQILSQAGNFVLSAAFRYKNVALGLLQ